MTISRNIKYLSAVALLGVWGCSPNQFASRSGSDFDDLYGNASDAEVAVKSRPAREVGRFDNPDFQSAEGAAAREGSADYFDETYLSSRNVRRPVSSEVGYNAGFREGYVMGQQAAFDPFFMNSYGGFWPGSAASFRMGFQMGINRSMRMGFSPFMGMGSFYAMNRMGYSPWGFGGMGFDPFMSSAMYGWGNPWGMGGMGMGMGMYGMGMGMYDPFWGMNSFGNPWGMGGWGMGGFGMNPWAYNRPVVIVNNNNDRSDYRRTYGPRGTTGARGADSYNSAFSNTTRSSRNAGGRQAYNTDFDNSAATSSPRGTSGSSDAYYARPRSNSSGTYYGGNSSSTGRTSSEGTSTYSGTTSRGTASNSDYYYSRPRANTSGTYSTPRSSGGVGTSSPVNSNRSYESSGTRSNSNYQSPSRTTAPSYNNQSSPRSSAPAPSSSPASSGGSSAPRSRGPR
jgi:hypothetical protein